MKTADNRVKSHFRDLTKTGATRSVSKYNITKDSSTNDIDFEIDRVAELMIDDWNVNWYPNCWLAFVLFS